MTQAEVLQLFRERAEALDTMQATQNDIIEQLASLLAESRGRLSKENFEVLTNIGAQLFKDGLARFKASSEIAATMERSQQEHEKRGP